MAVASIAFMISKLLVLSDAGALTLDESEFIREVARSTGDDGRDTTSLTDDEVDRIDDMYSENFK